jgi:CheY-like chemotaxis protein
MVYQANGFDAQARYSASEGFAFAQSFEPALMLCDVTMPDESGLQLACRLEQAMPQVRVLMLTAYASNAPEVRAQSRRMKRPLRLLSKPCRPDDLLRETHALLHGV